MSSGELVLYTADDGSTQIFLRAEDHSVWLTQMQLAELFETTKQNISLHIRNIFAEGELSPEATVKDSLTVQTEGKRQVQRTIQLYNLDLILAVDYHDDAQAVGTFFAEVQNKMLFSVTQRTAAEIIVERCNSGEPNMALTSWGGGRVRKADVTIAKNYLNATEIDQLNRIVVTFLEFAELRGTQRKALRMADWRVYVDNFIQFNERPLLQGAGQVSHERMVQVAHDCYETFDAQRRDVEKQLADALDIEALETVVRLPRKPPRTNK